MERAGARFMGAGDDCIGAGLEGRLPPKVPGLPFEGAGEGWNPPPEGAGAGAG